MPAARLDVVVGDEPAVRAALVRGLAAWLAAYDPGAWAVRDGHAARAADLVETLYRGLADAPVGLLQDDAARGDGIHAPRPVPRLGGRGAGGVLPPSRG